MTSISALGSTLSQYTLSISSLDKNGDGVVSADELAAANTNSKSATASSTSSSNDSSDNASKLARKIANDVMSLMLQMRSDDSDGDDSDSGGLLSSLDSNGDGKFTTSELLSTNASDGDPSSGNPLVMQLMTDMQTALKAYQDGTSADEDTVTVQA